MMGIRYIAGFPSFRHVAAGLAGPVAALGFLGCGGGRIPRRNRPRGRSRG